MYSATGEGAKLLSLTSAQPCRRFSLAEIQSATKDFDDKLVIGRGGFGKVYRGHICSEETNYVVAIKRLDSKSDQGAPEFRAEIEMLSQLRHCHLVSLIGYCDDNKEMILVYEYMANGTLYDQLHKRETPLNWVQRLKIAIGAARGLDYLHTGVGTQHGIIHRDVKSSNILLDENWAARISDFGLSIVGPTNQSSSFVDASVKGTFGYLDPEYFLTQKLTRKTDVYAFGVVLFELLSGRLAVDTHLSEEQCSLVKRAKKCVKERRFDQLVDSNIRERILPKCLRRFAQIAHRCLHDCLKERPTMTEVVASLQLLLKLQEKCNNSRESLGIMGFSLKINKYFVSPPKRNSGHSGTNSRDSSTDNTNQCSFTFKDGDDHHELPYKHREIVAGDLKMFTYEELKRAAGGSGNHECLGEGIYGKVCKGWVNKPTYSPSKHNTGMPVAIKRLHRYNFQNFESDLNLLTKFSHPNLVKLIGYCLHGKELFLVYEFMHNGKFEDYLGSGAVARLPMVTRVQMALGIARGLVFSQKTQDEFVSTQHPVGIVRQSLFRRCNILLDKDFTAKLSDFDMMMLVPYVGEYDDSPLLPCLNRPSNLTSFTVVLEEILTGAPIPQRKDVQIDVILEGPESLYSIAKFCFEICNDTDSESKMLSVLKKFDKYIPA